LNDLKGGLAPKSAASHFAADGQAILPTLGHPMQTNYIRFGRRYSIPSTAQILDELKTGFVANYVPISKGYNEPFARRAADEHLPVPHAVPIVIGRPHRKKSVMTIYEWKGFKSCRRESSLMGGDKRFVPPVPRRAARIIGKLHLPNLSTSLRRAVLGQKL
jgi:hypothetical protein